MILTLLILVPLVAGIISFLVKSEAVKGLALISSLATLVLSGMVAYESMNGALQFSLPWIPQLGAEFSLYADGMAAMLCLLTAIVMPLVFVSGWNKKMDSPWSFYGFMLLAQAGITGVFLAYDALLFYFCWELALIPVYFLCSRWGGEKRIAVTFKFFVYTFVGSLIM